jgi:hypothetical protein
MGGVFSDAVAGDGLQQLLVVVMAGIKTESDDEDDDNDMVDGRMADDEEDVALRMPPG